MMFRSKVFTSKATSISELFHEYDLENLNHSETCKVMYKKSIGRQPFRKIVNSYVRHTFSQVCNTAHLFSYSVD